MKSPAFWYPSDGRISWQARALSPFSVLYAGTTRARLRKSPRFHSPVPIVCVGNINAGGTGKTPTVIALIEELTRLGHRVAVVSRGYGGKVRGPVLVRAGLHSSEDVGDEPLLMSAFTSVWVARDRARGCEEAVRSGADVVVLDDGFQDPSVPKSLALVVVDASVAFGNGRVIPAGPLREPVSAGLDRASALISIGEPEDRKRFSKAWAGSIPVPLLEAELEPLQTGLPWHGLRVVAFAGIGRPEKFFRTLVSLGADIVRTVPLGDHQPLSPALLNRLALEARARNAQLVTTEKDAVRLPPSFRNKVVTLPVRLRFSEPERLRQMLQELWAG